VLVVGGGSAGWMSAAMLATMLQRDCTITLVESDEIGIVGVGEATIPPIRLFNETLGISEADFIRETRGTFKLGIEFVDWGSLGTRYFHPFGPHGRNFDMVPLHQYWLKTREEPGAFPLEDLSMAWHIAREGRMTRPVPDPRSLLSTFDYAYHFDAALYAAYLRRHAEARGVTRVEGKISDVSLNGETGFVESVTLEGGRKLEADLFIDCSGLRALLIEGALQTGFEDWSHWLPCDRAVAMPCASAGPPTPYTRSTAREAGWQWRIPLQHRIGNGYVYASQFMEDDKAASLLASRLDGEALGDPRFVRFRTGRRKQHWNRNVIAVGLSSGFLEPLESTSIHLIQTALNRLLDYFPDRTCDPVLAAAYNREAADEYAHIRDFLLLHYVPNRRHGEPFWDEIRAQALPESLAAKLELFRRTGRIVSRRRELFADVSWFYVAAGMGIEPQAFDPLADAAPFDEVRGVIGQISDVMGRYRAAAPMHGDMLARLLDPALKGRPSFGQVWGGA
jgi:tryptophan halogenase